MWKPQDTNIYCDMDNTAFPQMNNPFKQTMS